MSIGSLFSGIGGLELGLEMAGLGPVAWQCENDQFCRVELKRLWPGVPRYGDIRQLSNPPTVDLLCGGFPCTDVSSAGKGAGLAGRNSGLWFEYLRIIGETRPEWVVVENVASGANRWVDPVMAGLEQQGYQAVPVPLSARDVGAPHLRRRIFIIAHAHGEQLREQPGRRGRAVRKNEAFAGIASEVREAPDPQGNRWARERQWSEARYADWGGELRHGIETGRIHQPALCRVVDGVPYRVVSASRREELKALGNAVVPQCAEVIGWMIKEMANNQS